MTITKGRIVAVLVAIGVAAVFFSQLLSNKRLRDENRALSERVAQVDQPGHDTDQPIKSQQGASQPFTDEQFRELLRLRGEVGVLRKQLVGEAVRRTRETSTQTPQPQTQTDPAEQRMQFGMARMSYAQNWMLAVRSYADQNQQQCPTNFEQAASFLPDRAKTDSNLTPEQFEIVYEGSFTEITNAQTTIVIRQKEP
jgi:hypothetical protein